ncbi:MAG: hypothetical protein ACM3OF_03775 [Gemmatimonas sp.]
MNEPRLAAATAARVLPDYLKWQTIAGAPYDLDLELAVIDAEGPHALVFPCRRDHSGWIKTETAEQVDVHPTHWREWRD